MDTFLLEHSAGPTLELAPSVLAMREVLGAATSDLLTVPDDALEKPWPWLPGEDDADVRYGFYRCFEAIEQATGLVGRLLEESGAERSPASRLIALATVARWELHGVLAPLEDEILDIDPGGGDWPVRETLAHIVSTQRSYAWFSAWWVRHARERHYPPRVPEDVVESSGLPDRASEGAGGLRDIRRRLDAILDLGAGRLASYGDDDLAVRATWSGLPVTVGFRLGRWSSHIAEHTVQMDKTLAMLGRQPSEVGRLVRLIGAAYGRLEAVVFGVPPDSVQERADVGRSPGDVLRDLAEEVARTAGSVRIAAAT